MPVTVMTPTCTFFGVVSRLQNKSKGIKILTTLTEFCYYFSWGGFGKNLIR